MKPGYMYQYFDKDGMLLYVGSTQYFGNRHAAHQYSSPWAAAVKKFTVDVYDDIILAQAAEDAIILRDHPKYNKYHSLNHGSAGAAVSGERSARRAAAACDRILPFWHLPSSLYPTQLLCDQEGISRPTAILYLGSRRDAQKRHGAK